MYYSPLRYPGGKSRLAQFIGKICGHNCIREHYIEPYAGGGGVALQLLAKGSIARITLNDADRSIYAFWYAVLYETEALCKRIEEVQVSIETRKAQKAIQQKKDAATLLDLGFSTLFLNRTNRSGILKGGVIGGNDQEGKYKMDCRFNKKRLIERIRWIAAHKAQITIANEDAIALVKRIAQQESKQSDHMLFYLDPPYYDKGKSLYACYYTDKDHQALSTMLQHLEGAHWILSYDNTATIQKLYHWVAPAQKKAFTLSHQAFQSREGKELLVFSKSLEIKGIDCEGITTSS